MHAQGKSNILKSQCPRIFAKVKPRWRQLCRMRAWRKSNLRSLIRYGRSMYFCTTHCISLPATPYLSSVCARVKRDLSMAMYTAKETYLWLCIRQKRPIYGCVYGKRDLSSVYVCQTRPIYGYAYGKRGLCIRQKRAVYTEEACVYGKRGPCILRTCVPDVVEQAVDAPDAHDVTAPRLACTCVRVCARVCVRA